MTLRQTRGRRCFFVAISLVAGFFFKVGVLIKSCHDSSSDVTFYYLLGWLETPACRGPWEQLWGLCFGWFTGSLLGGAARLAPEPRSITMNYISQRDLLLIASWFSHLLWQPRPVCAPLFLQALTLFRWAQVSEPSSSGFIAHLLQRWLLH